MSTLSAAGKQGLCPKCSQEERPQVIGQCGLLAALSRSGGRGMTQAKRAATERAPRDPGTPAWRGLGNRGPDAPERSSNMGHGLSVSLWSLQHARQAWDRRGRREHLGSLLPLLPRARLIQRGRGTREGAGRKEPRSEYCTVLGTGL